MWCSSIIQPTRSRDGLWSDALLIKMLFCSRHGRQLPISPLPNSRSSAATTLFLCRTFYAGCEAWNPGSLPCHWERSTSYWGRSMGERKKLITICVPVYHEEQNADHSTTRFCVSWRRSPFRFPSRVYSPVLLLPLPQHPEAFCKLDVRRLGIVYKAASEEIVPLRLSGIPGPAAEPPTALC